MFAIKGATVAAVMLTALGVASMAAASESTEQCAKVQEPPFCTCMENKLSPDDKAALLAHLRPLFGGTPVDQNSPVFKRGQEILAGDVAMDCVMSK
jgi:hypothetical protein